MSLVQTTKGLIDDSVLVVKDIVENHENARVVATEWFSLMIVMTVQVSSLPILN